MHAVLLEFITLLSNLVGAQLVLVHPRLYLVRVPTLLLDPIRGHCRVGLGGLLAETNLPVNRHHMGSQVLALTHQLLQRLHRRLL